MSRDSIARSELAILYKNNYNQFNSTNIDKNQSNQKVKVNKENCESSESLEISNKARESLKHILRIYNNWKHLFQEENTTKTLSKYQS